MTGLFRLLGAALCFSVLSGCGYSVFVHQPPRGGFKLDKPRFPLNATLAVAPNNPDGEAVRKLLEQSGYFARVTPLSTAAKTADIDIAYQGMHCGATDAAHDSFLGTWWYTAKFIVVSVPTLGIVPPGAASETNCQQVFSYQFRPPRRVQARTVQYPFKTVEYASTARGVFHGDDKQKYQKAYLLDQSVAALLSDISRQLGGE
jgi:hypothetical protein